MNVSIYPLIVNVWCLDGDAMLSDSYEIDYNGIEMAYSDDLVATGNSLNDSSYDGGSGYHDTYDGLTINDHEQVV